MPADLPNMASFWAQVDAFRAAMVDNRVTSWGSIGKFRTYEGLWKQRGAEYMRGKGSLERDLVYQTKAQREASAAILTAGLSGVESGIIRAFDEVVGTHAIKTFGAWPVRTGVSKGALGLTVESSDHAYKATVASAAPYVIFIGTKRSTTMSVRRKINPVEGTAFKVKGTENAWMVFRNGEWNYVRDNAWLVKRGGKWVYDRRKEFVPPPEEVNPDRKPVVGVPFQDYLNKPAKALAEATAARAVENITTGKGT